MTVSIGFFIGFVYDLFRILRKTIKHPNIIIQIEDIIYWIFVSLIMFYILLSRNYGEVRAFSIIGAFLGMLIYFLTLSQLFLPITVKVIDFTKKIIVFVIKIVLLPIKFVVKLIMYPVNVLKNRCKKFKDQLKIAKRKELSKFKRRRKALAKQIKIIVNKK
jgi:spore cortex biosynthesis protein YabQ